MTCNICQKFVNRYTQYQESTEYDDEMPLYINNLVVAIVSNNLKNDCIRICYYLILFNQSFKNYDNILSSWHVANSLLSIFIS